MMMQPSTTMIKISGISYLMNFIIVRNHEETLKPSSLPSKKQFAYFARKDNKKWIYSMRINSVVPAVPVFINVQQYLISHKNAEF